MKHNRVIVKTLLIAVAALALLTVPDLRLPYLDRQADAYFADAMTKAGAAYGVCRAVNACVSVVKDSQIQIEPAGLGVSLAAGQILDPLDDMTERASDVLVTAIVSLGIQKIAYDLSVAFAPPLLGVALLAWCACSFGRGRRAAILRAMACKAFAAIVVARLCLPISSLISAELNTRYFSPQIAKTRNALTLYSPELERLKDLKLPEAGGALGTVRNSVAFVGEKASDLKAALQAMVRNADALVSNLLRVSYLYVAYFLFQVVLLPLGAFWLMARIARALFGTYANLSVSPAAVTRTVEPGA